MAFLICGSDGITILMMIGYGDRICTHEEVCNLFNVSDPQIIGRSTISDR